MGTHMVLVTYIAMESLKSFHSLQIDFINGNISLPGVQSLSTLMKQSLKLIAIINLARGLS